MDTEKLAKRLAKLREKNTPSVTNNVWLKVTDEKKKVRMVPYPHSADGNPFIEASFHYNIAGIRSLVCPNETFGEPCPICELAEEFRIMGGKENWKLYNNIKAKRRDYCPVVVRGNEDEGVKLWGFGVTICEELMEKFLDPEWGDLSDPTSGRDISVWSIPKKSPGNDSDYDKPKMDVSPNKSPLFQKKSDVVKLLENIPDFLNDGQTFKTHSYQELQDIVRKMTNVEEDTPESSYGASNSDKSYSEPSESSNSDEDDESERLNEKLKKLLGK